MSIGLIADGSGTVSCSETHVLGLAPSSPKFMLRKFRQILAFAAVLWAFTVQLSVAQGTYYASIDTSKSTFVTDLQNLIYPHTRITYDNYDETNIADFASRDTTGGQRAVTCVYTGYIYVYTPPFTWTVFSREHTWCQSWMPSLNASGFTSRPEYSDQFHIFPVHQNNANGRRSNHPLGKVQTITYQFMDGKLGTDSLGHTVYEPRDAQKGASARALLYMAVCYNGEGGYDWTFNHLNNVTLADSLHEAPEDPSLLIAWAKQYPPDDSEKSRNEYVYSIQGNRNPFIDHPYYVDLIDFNTLTKIGTQSLSAEPTNYATTFAVGTASTSSLQVTWTDAVAGTQSPAGYLLLANTSNSFSTPSDGSTLTDDTNLSDGSAVVHISYPSSGSYSFTGLSSSTTYYCRLYSYNGSGTEINYKTDGTAPSSSGTTSASSVNHLEIYEVYGGGGNSGSTYKNDYVVLYNPTSSSVSVAGWSVQYASAGGSTWIVTGLTGTMQSHSYFLVQEAQGAGGTTNLPAPDASGTITMAATAGEVALCNVVTALSGASPSGSQIIDFVGYGTSATAYEGSGPTAAPSNTNAVTRKSGGQDSDDNANDFSTSLPHPENSANALPVELASIAATANRLTAQVRWSTATEVNNYGFDIERKSSNGVWAKIGFVAGSGTSSSLHTYTYSDNVDQAGLYEYRIKQIDKNGTFKYSSTMQLEVGSVLKTLSLGSNYPNPFNPSTSIEFSVPTDGRAALKVYNMLGQQVATLFDGLATAGKMMKVTFDASRLTSGVYFSRLEVGGHALVNRMLFMK